MFDCTAMRARMRVRRIQQNLGLCGSLNIHDTLSPPGEEMHEVSNSDYQVYISEQQTFIVHRETERAYVHLSVPC